MAPKCEHPDGALVACPDYIACYACGEFIIRNFKWSWEIEAEREEARRWPKI